MKRLITLSILFALVGLNVQAQEPVNKEMPLEIIKQFPTTQLAHDRPNPVYIDLKNNGKETIESLELSIAVSDANGIFGTNKTFDNLNLNGDDQVRLRLGEVNVVASEECDIFIFCTKINGESVDYDELGTPRGRTLSHHTAATSSSVDMTVFAEMFSSSTCGPCATWNINVYSQILPQLNFNVPGSKRTIAKNQVPIPSAGDPSVNSYSNSRRGLYNANSAPRMYVQGDWVDYSQTTLTNWTDAQDYFSDAVDDAASTPSFVKINIDEFNKTVNGNNIEINVKGEIEAFANFGGQNIRLNVFVLNKDYVFSGAQNGDANYKHITRAVMPNDIGMRALNFNTGTTISFDETMTFVNQNGTVTANTTNLWNDRVEVVVIVQNRSSNEVLQAAYANEFLSNSAFAALESNASLYPNPAINEGVLELTSPESGNMHVEIIATGGQVLHTQQVNAIADQPLRVQLPAVELSNGMYIVRVYHNNSVITKKWMIQKP